MAHTLLSLLVVAGALFANAAGERENTCQGPSFLTKSDLGKGLTETRVFIDGVMGMETTLKRQGRAGVHLRQVSDGRTLVQLAYRNANDPADCRISSEQSQVNGYIERFLGLQEGELNNAERPQFSPNHNVIPSEVHTRLQSAMPDTLLEVAEGSLAENLARLVDLETAENVCNRLSDAVRSHTMKQKKKKASSKRSRRQVTIMPGTQYCGRGNGNGAGEDVVHIDADRCCQEHDECPHFISAFSTKYGLFNYRLHTISHCACDDLFRTCLRMAATDYTDWVGRIYFNHLELACFHFQPYLECAERNWWGKCIRRERRFKAVVSDESFEY